MREFHDCNCNGLGDIWWTDKCMYFCSIDYVCVCAYRCHGFSLKQFEFVIRSVNNLKTARHKSVN